MQNEPLDFLGRKYGTDKASSFHCYLDIYDFWLHDRRGKIRKVLEIGIGNGASLKMWADYFPYAQIFGVDIEPDRARLELGDRIQCHELDATNVLDWQNFFKHHGTSFDLIVDDGGHNALDQIRAFQNAWTALAPEGLYFVEDLHMSYTPEANRRLLEPELMKICGTERMGIRFFLSLVHQVNEWGAGQCGKRSGTQDIEFAFFSKSLCILQKTCAS